MKLCHNEAQHAWELNAEGFVKVSNGAMFCTVCGHTEMLALSDEDIARASSLRGIAEPESEKPKLLPGLGG